MSRYFDSTLNVQDVAVKLHSKQIQKTQIIQVNMERNVILNLGGKVTKAKKEKLKKKD